MLDQVTAQAIISSLMALLGGGMSMFGKKRPEQNTQLQRYNPEQQDWMSQLGQMGMQGLQNPMEGFEPIAEQAKSQFQQQTVPSLAERFTSLGAGSQGSSAFQGSLGRAGAGLSRDLAGMGAQYGLQRTNQLQNMMNTALTPQFENMYRPEQSGRARTMGANLFSSNMPGLQSGLSQLLQKIL